MTQWKCFVQTHLLFVTMYGLVCSSSVTFKHQMKLVHSNVSLVTQHHFIWYWLPEVQNRDISGPKEKDSCPQEIKCKMKNTPVVTNYRLQTKFAKVMFSQVSVCPRGGVCPIACWNTQPLGADTPSTPGADSPG